MLIIKIVWNICLFLFFFIQKFSESLILDQTPWMVVKTRAFVRKHSHPWTPPPPPPPPPPKPFLAAHVCVLLRTFVQYCYKIVALICQISSWGQMVIFWSLDFSLSFASRITDFTVGNFKYLQYNRDEWIFAARSLQIFSIWNITRKFSPLENTMYWEQMTLPETAHKFRIALIESVTVCFDTTAERVQPRVVRWTRLGCKFCR